MTTPADIDGILESEVAANVAHSIGFIQGYAAANKIPDTDVEYFSFAGPGKNTIDSLIGDASIRTGLNWYLLELKRNFAGIIDEIKKEKTENFLSKFTENLKMEETHEPDDRDGLYTTAKTAHLFLFLDVVDGRLKLTTCSYFKILQNFKPTKGKNKVPRVDLLDLLAEPSKSSGFAYSQFIEYVKQLGEWHTTGAGEAGKDRVILAVEKSGKLHVFSYGSLINSELINNFESTEPTKPTGHSRNRHGI